MTDGLFADIYNNVSLSVLKQCGLRAQKKGLTNESRICLCLKIRNPIKRAG